MRIGIDWRVLTGGARTGVEEYTLNISRYLIEQNPETEVKIFYNAYSQKPIDFPWLHNKNVKFFSFHLPNRPLYFTGRFLNQPKIDKLLGGVDVYFNPHFFWASTESAKQVITFHDLSFIRFPEFLPLRKKVWHRSLWIREQARRADKIIAVSNSTAQDLKEFYRIPEGKISVIPEGVDHAFFKPLPKEEVSNFKKEKQLPENFILFVGTFEPRKNILGLLEAFEAAHREKTIPGNWQLVLAGGRGWKCNDIFRKIQASEFKLKIKIFQVAHEDRPLLYNAAKIFVYPSYFEGFGLPVLEAMACGVPVIASNRSSISEVSANAAILIDPYRVDELVNAVQFLAENSSLQEKFIKVGIERAQQFSWEKAARETFEILKSALRIGLTNNIR